MLEANMALLPGFESTTDRDATAEATTMTQPTAASAQSNGQRPGLRGKPWPKGTSGNPSGRTTSKRFCELYDAMLADLQSALHGSHLPLDPALELEARNLRPVMQSDSTRRGVEAFQQGKRFWFT